MINRFLARATLAALLAFAQSLTPAGVSVAQGPKSGGLRQAGSQSETLDSLKARIAAHISQPRFAPAAWGLKVVSLDSGKVIFEQNAQKYFNPASNAKLYTAALALDRLGADYRIKTSLYSTARPDATGTLKGDLIIYGRGDPLMTARLNGGDYYKGLEPLADQLASAGVRRIEGDLVGDESYFAGPPIGSGWEWDDLQEYYGAEVSALTVNDNSIDILVKPGARPGVPCRVTTGPAVSFVTVINRIQTAPKGVEARVVIYRPLGENIVYVSGRLPVDHKGYIESIAVHNPAGLFVSLFKNLLARRGIAVAGRSRVIDWKYREVTPIDFTRLTELGVVESAPIKDLVRETLKPSQNLYAQLLLLHVGASYSHATWAGSPSDSAEAGGPVKPGAALPPATGADARAERTTEELGVEAMGELLTRAGVRKGDVLLEEGSGLSRRDVITPDATVAMLSFMSRHRLADAYRNALPVAGVDGTLKNRMKETAAAGNVRAKTGTLRYVYALSGYVTTAGGERLAFSILLNNYFNSDKAVAAREDIDAIPIMLAEFSGRTQ
ncbi:MAG TPA: D-alanyl-D-alanine carboxypeptidase/D-alanyl-D-alanine-endopeptidase [Blastocatellia bacterium]|jgi:D-alanyl-D-alanine carboxypeptidase/D-alanyl-D-alanine-endopeptidase (penicillin-binding protein 4)|nr:D-alanyl-D-alanine carboxypeptidase/D-alanyl-D-alanine-endopeptidase [Blastocatellia bacterium]